MWVQLYFYFYSKQFPSVVCRQHLRMFLYKKRSALRQILLTFTILASGRKKQQTNFIASGCCLSLCDWDAYIMSMFYEDR